MDKLESWKKTEDIEIDLMDLLRSIFMRWKQVLACALFGALVISGYGWMREKNAAEAAGSGAAGEIELTEEEGQGVEAAVQLQAESRALEEYLEESVLMQIDPYHKNQAVMLYSIEDAKRQDLPKIVESYLMFAAGGGAAKELQKSKDWKIDRSYLAELVLAYQRTDKDSYQIILEDRTQDNMPAKTLFIVEITGADAKMTKQLAQDMQSVLEEAQKTIAQTAGSHKLALAGSGLSEAVDSDLQIKQHDKRTLLQTNLANLKTMTDAFTEGQKAVYAKAAGLETADGSAEGAGGQGRQEAAPGLGISARYVVIGLAGGIFLYCCIYTCLYMCRDTLKSADELKRIYTFPFYGCISAEKKQGGAGRDRKADGISPKKETGADRPGTGQDTGEQMRTAGRIRLACRSQGITQLVLASDFSFTSREKECLEGIISRLEEWGIKAFSAENAGSAAALWDDMVKAGNVLVVCRIGTTTRRMMDEQMRFYMENGIAVAGAVAFT